MSKGEGQHGLAVARAALAARDGAIGDADRALTGVVSSAVAQATEAIRRIEAVQTEIESTTCCDGTALENREQSRLLLQRQHEIITTITRTRADVSAKTIELQHIMEQYQHCHR